MSRFTVLGANGFIGAAMTAHLRAAGHDVNAVGRAGMAEFLADCRPAGHVIYCIGLTGDFRARPLETADAHVGLVGRVLAHADLASFLYLSSTRVYARADTGREDSVLVAQPTAASDLYNITKLAGEALCLSDARPTVRAARLSNVYGPGMGTDSFLGQVLAEGAATGGVTLRQNLRSAKDYVALTDVVPALHAIAERGQARLYNVASGANITHDQIAGVLTRSFGWSIAVDENAAGVRFPRIDTNRLSIEFGPPRRALLDDLPQLGAALGALSGAALGGVMQRQEVAC